MYPRFNLVIEMLFFSRRERVSRTWRSNSRFNLVIEMLFFSRGANQAFPTFRHFGFNLVIEMLFFSSLRLLAIAQLTSITFQSRNRDAFLFKSESLPAVSLASSCFNLVIEMLFFSSFSRSVVKKQGIKFQSRNRDAFLFKRPAHYWTW